MNTEVQKIGGNIVMDVLRKHGGLLVVLLVVMGAFSYIFMDLFIKEKKHNAQERIRLENKIDLCNSKVMDMYEKDREEAKEREERMIKVISMNNIALEKTARWMQK